MQEDQVNIPLAEEHLRVDKTERLVGRVRISTRTDEVEELVRADLDETAVEVRRVVIDRVVDQVPEIRVEGDVTVVPVLEEVLVVEKRLVLKEELHLVRRTTTHRVEQPVVLRRQSASVERIDEENQP